MWVGCSFVDWCVVVVGWLVGNVVGVGMDWFGVEFLLCWCYMIGVGVGCCIVG